MVVDLELTDGVGVECGGAVVNEGEGSLQRDGGVGDGVGGVVGEVEVAREAWAGAASDAGGRAELGAEVDLGSGEVEVGGLGVGGEENGVGADDAIGRDEAAGGRGRGG
ncbi:hypothetical protein RBB78_17085 [Tunturiibacter empetritectus]|uniref:hypothetical protein n=1 Tax=Tunturiibacter empetritectus TaxID=3069691 RepID=UPI003D9B6FDD